MEKQGEDGYSRENLDLVNKRYLHPEYTCTQNEKTATVSNKSMEQGLHSTLRTLDRMKEKAIFEIDVERDKIQKTLSMANQSPPFPNEEYQFRDQQGPNHLRSKSTSELGIKYDAGTAKAGTVINESHVDNRDTLAKSLKEMTIISSIPRRLENHITHARSLEDITNVRSKNTLPPITQAHRYQKNASNSSKTLHIKPTMRQRPLSGGAVQASQRNTGIKISGSRSLQNTPTNSPAGSPINSPLLPRRHSKFNSDITSEIDSTVQVRRLSDHMILRPGSLALLLERRKSDPQVTVTPESGSAIKQSLSQGSLETKPPSLSDTEENAENGPFVQPYAIMSSMSLYSNSSSHFEERTGKKGLKAWMGKEKTRKPRRNIKKYLI